MEYSDVTEELFHCKVKFDELSLPLEEKLTAKELIPGFFEFNQAISNSADDVPLWSFKLIFDTSQEWFSFTFTGEERHFVSSIGSDDLFER